MYVQTNGGLGNAYLTQLKKEAAQNCAGVDVLLRLTRLTPLERILFAKRKLKLIPQLIRLQERVKAQLKADPNNLVHLRNWKQVRSVVNKWFGDGYVLSSEKEELARARCEMSRARVDAELWQ